MQCQLCRYAACQVRPDRLRGLRLRIAQALQGYQLACSAACYRRLTRLMPAGGELQADTCARCSLLDKTLHLHDNTVPAPPLAAHACCLTHRRLTVCCLTCQTRAACPRTPSTAAPPPAGEKPQNSHALVVGVCMCIMPVQGLPYVQLNYQMYKSRILQRGHCTDQCTQQCQKPPEVSR